MSGMWRKVIMKFEQLTIFDFIEDTESEENERKFNN